MLVKVLVQHSFSLREARRISNNVFDSAARLALHRATIAQLYKSVNEDLVRLIMELRIKDCSSKNKAVNTDSETSSTSSFLSDFSSDSSHCYTPVNYYRANGMQRIYTY